MSEPKDPAWRPETLAVIGGRRLTGDGRTVNPPIERGSSLLFDSLERLNAPGVRTYGISGLAAQDALREALCLITGAAAATLAPSGLMACTLALLAVAKPGAHLLVVDSVYGPTRRFCNTTLKRLGVETEFTPPDIGAAIEARLRPETCAVFLESPGSLTMELQDVPAIAAVCAKRGVVTLIDDTWSAGVLFRPFEHGVDYAIQALTKYQAGHADVLLGAVLARTPELGARMAHEAQMLGLCVAPEDAFLTLRGLRTMAVRMKAQEAAGLQVARWLAGQPWVARVLHPALDSHPDHTLWARDFTGAAGVFSVMLAPTARPPEQALGRLRLFGLGYSWGGYESLIVPAGRLVRTASAWDGGGPLLRLSIGLEHPDDLIADLAQAFC